MDIQNEIYWKRKDLEAKAKGYKICDKSLFKRKELFETITILGVLLIYFLFGIIIGIIASIQLLYQFGFLVV